MISAQHARALTGACAHVHARNAAHVERQNASAIAGAHACMSMHACAHLARLRHGFEENVLAWTKEHVISTACILAWPGGGLNFEIHAPESKDLQVVCTQKRLKKTLYTSCMQVTSHAGHCLKSLLKTSK